MGDPSQRILHCEAPQWCERWFINPMNTIATIVISAINHSEMGVNLHQLSDLPHWGTTLVSILQPVTFRNLGIRLQKWASLEASRQRGHCLSRGQGWLTNGFRGTLWQVHEGLSSNCLSWNSPFSDCKLGYHFWTKPFPLTWHQAIWCYIHPSLIHFLRKG
jgi:hypothetical protein